MTYNLVYLTQIQYPELFCNSCIRNNIIWTVHCRHTDSPNNEIRFVLQQQKEGDENEKDNTENFHSQLQEMMSSADLPKGHISGRKNIEYITLWKHYTKSWNKSWGTREWGRGCTTLLYHVALWAHQQLCCAAHQQAHAANFHSGPTSHFLNSIHGLLHGIDTFHLLVCLFSKNKYFKPLNYKLKFIRTSKYMHLTDYLHKQGLLFYQVALDGEENQVP